MDRTRRARIRLGLLSAFVLATAGGEWFFKGISPNETAASYCLALGILFLVAADPILQLLCGGKDSEDVLDEVKRVEGILVDHLERVNEKLPSSVEVRELERFRKRLHHYHLTQNACGECVWVYKILNFDTQGQAFGKLTTRAPVLVNQDDEREHNIYLFEASISGPHLLMVATNAAEDLGNPDIGVELFPYAQKPPFYGARIITTNEKKPVTTISVLHTKPYGNDSEGPVSPETAKKLLDLWVQCSGIGRLPLELGKSQTATAVPALQ